jgi:glycosyltransferase involved in cell wall biosynthesis
MADTVKKRILIISYYWPPAGGIGVHRCLKFAKYLCDYGWEPVIYAPKNADYPFIDESNFKHIPKDLEIIYGKIIEPFSLFKKLSGRKKTDNANPVYVRDRKRSFFDKLGIWIRGNLFIPDARALWIKPSVRLLKKYLANHPVDAILTDGPPHTNTMIGCKLSESLNIPWLADFQDPWTQVDYYKMLMIGKRADRIHKKLEKHCLNIAAKVTIASPTWAKEIEELGAQNAEPIFWGYDEDDFPNETVNLDQKFTILHAGQLGYDRYPETFLKVLTALKNENPEFAAKLCLRFAGTVDYAIEKSIHSLGLSDNYEALGKITFPEAIKYTLQAQLLLLPLNIADNAHGRIPGKLFENLRAHRPILCLGPNGSDVSEIISETQSGKSFEYDNAEGIKTYILELFKKFSEGIYTIEQKNITQYNVKNQVKKLSDLLHQITESNQHKHEK